MLNIEKYEEEIKKQILKDRDIPCIARELRDGDSGCGECRNCATCGLEMLHWLLQEYKEPIKPILTEKEKIIINNILKAIEPFGAEVQCVAKYRQGDEPTDYYLNFSYKNSNDDFDTFTFNGNELFVGMEVDELYTLKDLGL